MGTKSINRIKIFVFTALMILWLTPMTKTTKYPNLVWRRVGLVILAAITPIFLVKLPSSGVSSDLPLDKIIHLLFHFSLCSWFLIGFEKRKLVFIFSALYGLGIEIAQSFTVYRTFELADLLANILGASVAIVVFKYLLRR
mgnify:CR=1 FL=1|tara:strand:+ start:4087 stop:4509 length:423 start_codon:yes stop_codon:yes gene_type:complete